MSVPADDAPPGRSRRERKAQAWRGRSCENCNVPLQGPFCHRCGQPEKTPIRDLLSLSTDAVDYLFDVDARLWKTLRDLFLRPGRLTEAYLRGKRMSFVRPLRVYLVLSALLFVVVSSMSDMDGLKVSADGDVIVADETESEGWEHGTRGREHGSAAIPQTTPDGTEDGTTAAGADATATPDDAGAATGAKGTAAAAGRARTRIEVGMGDEPVKLTFFGDRPWHPTDNPLRFEALPEFVHVWLNDTVGVIQANIGLVRKDPKRLGHAFLRVLPQSLFVLLPVFALLLKIVLAWKRRLYMEHLMVAIHSHTFIYMGILVTIGLSWVAERWPAGWTNPWWMLMGLAIAWIPVNLFLTQKRVYRQSWWGAQLTYLVIGTLYLCLVGFTAFGALVASLVSL